VQALLNELEMMLKLRHPNIVSFVEYFLQDDVAEKHFGACIIVMQLLEGPDMMDYIDETGGFPRESAKVCDCSAFRGYASSLLCYYRSTSQAVLLYRHCTE
jgi:serine/threonine protein kinase